MCYIMTGLTAEMKGPMFRLPQETDMDPLQCRLLFSRQSHCTVAQHRWCREVWVEVQTSWREPQKWWKPQPDSHLSLWCTTSFSCTLLAGQHHGGAKGDAGSPLCCAGIAQPAHSAPHRMHTRWLRVPFCSCLL